jgi:hypothetical protein
VRQQEQDASGSEKKEYVVNPALRGDASVYQNDEDGNLTSVEYKAGKKYTAEELGDAKDAQFGSKPLFVESDSE